MGLLTQLALAEHRMGGLAGYRPAAALLRRKGKTILPVRPMSSAAAQSMVLAPAGASTRAVPNFGDGAPPLAPGLHPGLRAHLLHDARTSVYHSQIRLTDAFLLPDLHFAARERLEPNKGTMGDFDKHRALCDARPLRQFDRAILLGGDGSDNWYHYVIECGAKAWLARHLPDAYADWPLLVPAEARKPGPFADLVAALMPGRTLLDVGPATVRVERLVVFDEVSHGPFNFYPGLWPRLDDYVQHDDTLLAMVAFLRQALIPPALPAPQSRLYLARPPGRRDHNQAELIDIAARHGFVAVSPERLTLREQAALFAGASHVLGASGAAWTNMIFAPPTLRALTWILPEYSEFCSYSALAALLGQDLRYIVTDTGRPVRDTHDAFLAPYTVPPAAFEAALLRLLES